jgi:hypothetical protein
MFVIIIGILWLAAILYTIKDVFERTDMDRNTQLLWAILIVVAPFLGMAIYYVFGDGKRR